LEWRKSGRPTHILHPWLYSSTQQQQQHQQQRIDSSSCVHFFFSSVFCQKDSSVVHIYSLYRTAKAKLRHCVKVSGWPQQRIATDLITSVGFDVGYMLTFIRIIRTAAMCCCSVIDPNHYTVGLAVVWSSQHVQSLQWDAAKAHPADRWAIPTFVPEAFGPRWKEYRWVARITSFAS